MDEASPELRISGPDTVHAGEWISLGLWQKHFDENLGVRLWENSNPEVARLQVTSNSINGLSAGLDSLKPGVTTVTAILTDGRSASKTITVTEALAPMELSLPGFPCTVEGYGSSGELAYRVTITGASYDYDSSELYMRVQGTVDYAAPGFSQILIYFTITDDATGEEVDMSTSDIILEGTEGAFRYVPSGYSADAYPTLYDGHTYTLSFH